jgi:uncharacterized membrane protein YeaQ/YmgE (transglycosylase-associated protein family)
MGILWTIVLGFVIGVMAKLLHPGRENMGFIATIVLGVAGSFLAGVRSASISAGIRRVKGPGLSFQ